MTDQPQQMKRPIAVFALFIMTFAGSYGRPAAVSESRVSPVTGCPTLLRSGPADVVKDLEAAGIVRFANRRIFISEIIWMSADAVQKEALTSNLVIYDECRRNPTRESIIGTGSVYGMQSGTRLARITLFGGFRIDP